MTDQAGRAAEGPGDRIAIDALDLEAEFPVLGELAYLNHAGVAPMSGRAAEAMRTYATQASTRGAHQARWYSDADRSRATAARLIGAASPSTIAWIPNTSTGLALVARGLDWRRGDNVVITGMEYPANRFPWEDLQRLGVEFRVAEPLPDGRIDLEDVLDLINARTRVVSVSHVQYATGQRLPLRPIADLVHEAGGYLCVDAIQSVGAMPVDVEGWGVDFLAADGHKWMLGPEGWGVFYCREELCEMLHPAIVGWLNMVNPFHFDAHRFRLQRDARRFEPGSYNVAGVVALAASLTLLDRVGTEAIWSRIEALTGRLCAGLAERGYRVVSPRDEASRSGIVVFEPERERGESPGAIVRRLGDAGVVIVERSGRLRASPHFYNGEAQIDALLERLP